MRALFLEYPNDKETFKLNAQFLFGKELLVAPVVEKGAVTKDVYLPEGEWVNFNDGKTLYKGSQWVTVDAPLNVIPLFVKKGSIIPTMPVMQYIHEIPVYPVSLEVFPGNINKAAEFSLYEYDGENNDYQKNIFASTKFVCLTRKDGYNIQVSQREAHDFKTPDGRNFVFKLRAGKKPAQVLVNGKKIKPVKSTAINDAQTDVGKQVWAWDEAAGICYVIIQDSGLESNITIL